MRQRLPNPHVTQRVKTRLNTWSAFDEWRHIIASILEESFPPAEAKESVKHIDPPSDSDNGSAGVPLEPKPTTPATPEAKELIYA